MICHGGRGSEGPPAFLKKFSFKTTWYTQTDSKGEINCAAFALAVWTFKNTRRLDRIIKEARQLQTDLKYEEYTSIADLEKYIKKYPTTRVLVLAYVETNPASSHAIAYSGDLYDEENDDGSSTCKMLLYKSHWSLVESFDTFLHQATKKAARLRYCTRCVEIVKVAGEKVYEKDYPCHSSAPIKKQKFTLLPCRSPQCNGEVHNNGPCPFFRCTNCAAYFGSSDHRCILLPRTFGEPDPYEKHWTGSNYNFETEDGDGSSKAYFVYDLETMIVKETLQSKKNLIKPEASINYEIQIDNAQYSNEYNSMVPNLVVCTNIYSSTVPTNSTDPKFDPTLIRFHGPDCMEKFLEYATTFNKGNNVFVAHNGSGFDSKFIYAEALKQKLPNSHILRGTNFISLVLGGARSQKTKFIDSMLHLPGSLSGLAEGFFGKSPDKNLRESLTKGYFPHAFNTVANQDYIGPIPDLKYFTLDTMKLGSGSKKFESVIKIQNWHKEQEGKIWDFKKELVKYCDIDVIILAALMQTYMAISIPKGAIPLDFTTSPAFVHEIILLKATKNIYLPTLSAKEITKELRENNVGDLKAATIVKRRENQIEYESLMKKYLQEYWAVLKEPEYHFVRKSLRGGRTEIRDRLMRLTPQEEALGIKIVYQDVTSLYPAMQLTKQFPCGIPKIHFYEWSFRPCITCSSRKDSNKEYITECNCSVKGYNGKSLDLVDCRGTQPSLNEIMGASFFGYVCVTLIPPDNLYHPVIQIKKTRDKSTKCENNLVVEDHVKIYLDTPTFKHALEVGYKLIKVHRYDEYKAAIGHWVEAGMEFFVDKERTSGPAPSSTTQGLYCKEFVKEFPYLPTPPNERDAYVKLYNYIVPGLGKKLEHSMNTEEWSKQPAQRQVYKIFNNCGWGKHAQRPVMPQAQTFDSETEYKEIATLFENVSKGLYNLKGCIVYNNGKSIMYTWENTEKCNVNLHNSYLAAGAMVPAYGRLTLLEGLETVGENLAMCDTDSTVYKTSVFGHKNIPFSSLLGRFKEEDISLDGIVEFVGFGPKCYSIKTKKLIDVALPDGSTIRVPETYTRLKGIRQTVGCQGIDHEFMVRQMEKYLDTGEVTVTKVPQWGIKTKLDFNGAPLIYTMDYLKDFKLMGGDDMKGFHIKGDSKLYPFGYKI